MNYDTNNTLFCLCSYWTPCTYTAAFYNWTGRPDTYLFVPIPPPMFTVPGMMVGCLPRKSMFASTLQCFYSRSCLNLIQISSIFTPLDPTIESRFSINMTIETIFAELFIETWNNQSNFTNYYQICASRICSYTNEERQSVIYVITIFISILGGLTLTLRLIIPLMIITFRILQEKCNSKEILTSNTNENELCKKIFFFL